MADFDKRCVYCWQNSDTLKALPPEHKDSPKNKYCEKCYPEIYRTSLNLPWNRGLHKK